MKNLYYVDYVYECQGTTVEGGIYLIDTGVGIIELGGWEDDLLYDDTFLDRYNTSIRQWCKSTTFTHYKIVKL